MMWNSSVSCSAYTSEKATFVGVIDASLLLDAMPSRTRRRASSTRVNSRVARSRVHYAGEGAACSGLWPMADDVARG
eukprot:7123376-Prymnesium_polylepis.1